MNITNPKVRGDYDMNKEQRIRVEMTAMGFVFGVMVGWILISRIIPIG